MIKGRTKTIGEALLHLEKRVLDTKNHQKVVRMRDCFKSLREVNPDQKTEKEPEKR